MPLFSNPDPQHVAIIVAHLVKSRSCKEDPDSVFFAPTSWIFSLSFELERFFFSRSRLRSESDDTPSLLVTAMTGMASSRFTKASAVDSSIFTFILTRLNSPHESKTHIAVLATTDRF